MFGFLQDVFNYESRVIGRWDNETGTQMVSTARVSDGRQPYETAFMHPEYNDGKMVIVEAYDTEDQAMQGHERWQKVMTAGPLPDDLRDCANADIEALGEALGCDFTFPRKRTS